MTGDRTVDTIHLREYLRILRKHAWLIAACFLLITGAAAIGTYVQRPVYSAATRALIEREVPRVVAIQEVTPAGGETAEFFQTQIQIIRSRPVIQRVIDTLGMLERRPDLAASKDPVESFLGAVAVEPVRNTRLVEIRVEDTDPKLAAEIANAIANGYVRQTLELKLTAAREALTWLTAQVSDLKAKVNDSELNLQRYREQAGLTSAEEKQNLAAKKLGEFNSGYIDAKAKRLEMETRLNELKKGAQSPEALEASPLVINNPLVQRLKGQLVELEVQRSKLLKTYREKHPEVLKIQSQIDEITQKIKEETTRLVASLESEYNALKAREAAMGAAVNQYRDEVQGLAKKEIQFGILKREADSNQQLYDLLLKRLKETGLSQGLDTNNVRIVDPAVVPVRPIRPRPVLNLAIGAVIGMVFGVAVAFFIEYMDDTVHTPEQVENALGVPVFALIPAIPTRNRA
jgi:polysaccharide biosynthesis transport protein